MDPDGVLTAEADLEEHFRHRQSSSSYVKAQDALRISAGGIDRSSSPDESTALLSDPRAPSPTADAPADGASYLDWPGASDYIGLPWYKTPSIYWLLPPFLLFTLAFGGVIVPKVNLVKDLICRDYYRHQALIDPHFHYEPIRYGEDDDLCRAAAVQSRTSLFMMGDSVLGGILTAFTSPFIGALADRYGRTRVMVITSIGGILKEIFSIFAALYMDTFPVGLLYIGFIADGLCGSFIAGMAVSNAYASDTTPPLKRNVAFGYFHACLFTGIAVGPIVAGLIIKATGTLLTMFLIAFGCHLVFIFALLFVIPESLPKFRQKAAREKYEFEMEAQGRPSLLSRVFVRPSKFFAPLKVLYPVGEGSSPALRRNLILLCSIDVIMFGVAMGALNVFLLYSIYQFGWGTFEQSQYVSIVNTVRVSTLFIVLPIGTRLARGAARGLRTQRQSGCDTLDLVLIRSGVLIDTLGFVGLTLARTGEWFTFAGCVTALGGIAAPTLQSAQTKHVPHHQVGQLLGATGMLHSLVRVVAPLAFSSIFSATIDNYSQAVFLCLTVGFAAAWVLTWFLKPHVQVGGSLLPHSGPTEDARDGGDVADIHADVR